MADKAVAVHYNLLTNLWLSYIYIIKKHSIITSPHYILMHDMLQMSADQYYCVTVQCVCMCSVLDMAQLRAGRCYTSVRV